MSGYAEDEATSPHPSIERLDSSSSSSGADRSVASDFSEINDMEPSPLTSLSLFGGVVLPFPCDEDQMEAITAGFRSEADLARQNALVEKHYTAHLRAKRYEYFDDVYGTQTYGKVPSPDPKGHWHVIVLEGEQSRVQHPLRVMRQSEIDRMRHDNQIPFRVKIRPLMPLEDSTRLSPYHASIHPGLLSYGVQFCAYLRIPVEQLSVNALTALTAVHVLWRCAGCGHPTPAEVLQIYHPRLGTRKGHHSVIEFLMRVGKKSNESRIHLMDKMPSSQTA